MNTDRTEDEINVAEFSLMNENLQDNSVSTEAKIDSLAAQVSVLVSTFQDYIAVIRERNPSINHPSGDRAISVLTPPKVVDAIKINSLESEHVISRLMEIEFYTGQLPPGTPPIKAGQLVTNFAHDLIMQEIRSGTYAQFGINHGQGALEWCSLANMDYTTFKSMLVLLVKPKSPYELRQKLKQIPVLISDKVLKESFIFSQATRLNVVKKYLEEIKKFHDLFYPQSLQFYSKSTSQLETYLMDSEFLPIFKPGDDKDDPQSLLKILEKMLVFDKQVLSKPMFNSIFSSITSSDIFVRSLLQTVNKVVFEAAAQSGDKATVAKLEGFRRASITSATPTEPEQKHPASAFDVLDLFYSALNVKPTEACHPRYLFVGATEEVSWTLGLLNVAFFNIRVLQEFQLRVKELFQKMHTSSPPTRSSLQQLVSISPQDLDRVAEQQLINSLSEENSLDHHDYRYGDVLDFESLSAHLTHLSSQYQHSLNAVKPYSIEKGYSSGGGGRAQTHRKPCYKLALRGSCEDQNCRFSHEQRDIEKLQGDPGYITWCQKVKQNSVSNNLEAVYQLAAAEIENLKQDNFQLADMVAWKSSND